MAKGKNALFDALENQPTGAPLAEQKEPKQEPSVKPKLLNALPTAYEKAHEKGKQSGITSLDYSRYIYEAIREKLQRDGLL